MCVFLCYDDLGKTWSYSYYKKQLLFYVGDEVIVPTVIFKRAFFLLSEQPPPIFQKYFHFCSAVERWKGGSYIGSRFTNIHNCLKAFQLNSTIREAARKTKSIRILTPRSYFIKGDPKLLKQLLEKEKELIVKSCSLFSTVVVTNTTFMAWDLKHLANLPTFFQQCIRGDNIRTHLLDNDSWSLLIETSKDLIDYRYAFDPKLNHYFYSLNPEKVGKNYRMPKELKEFFSNIAQLENVRLMGLDFIKDKDRFYCLEANPNPGWAYYLVWASQRPLIAHAIVKKLLGAT